MDKAEILKTFNKYPMFAHIVASIEDDKNWGDMYLNNLVSMNFRGEMDLILYVRNYLMVFAYMKVFYWRT